MNAEPTTAYDDLSAADVDEIARRIAAEPLHVELHGLALVLLREVRHLRLSRAMQRREHADLVASVRATLAAAADGEPDALAYLRDELASTDDDGLDDEPVPYWLTPQADEALGHGAVR